MALAADESSMILGGGALGLEDDSALETVPRSLRRSRGVVPQRDEDEDEDADEDGDEGKQG